MIYMDHGKIYREIKCPECNGRGWFSAHTYMDPLDRAKCSACNGTGKVRHFYKNLTEALEATEQKKPRAKTTGIDDLKPMKHDTLIMDDVEEMNE